MRDPIQINLSCQLPSCQSSVSDTSAKDRRYRPGFQGNEGFDPVNFALIGSILALPITTDHCLLITDHLDKSGRNKYTEKYNQCC